MPLTFPRLLGDIGGTNVRWAWQHAQHQPLTHIQVAQCRSSPSPVHSARQYLLENRLPTPTAACLGVATAVAGDLVKFTNSPWSFSIDDLKADLGLQKLLVINDFTALALSLPDLERSDIRPIGNEISTSIEGTLGLIGPGTGLGVSGMVVDGHGKWAALSGEGGHVTVAPTNAYEASLLAWLRNEFGHVSAERVLSGSGLVNLYRAICAIAECPALCLEPREVSARAISGEDPLCKQAVQSFVAFLGNISGNLALTLGAKGGVFIGGGVVPKLGSSFDVALFRENFENKGRFQTYLKSIPTWLITAEAPALLGAARALDDSR